jgi:predicted NodU family carbamoyl transferase
MMKLNTSFNAKGQPIVNTPRGQSKPISAPGDALFLGNFLIIRA